MLALTRKTEYALVAMTHLAGLGPGELASTRKIAGLFGVPTSLLMNVLKKLASEGYVESTRGARGGYRLARAPEQINLADLVGALEGPVRLADCMGGEGGDNGRQACRIAGKCPIADPVRRVGHKLTAFLKEFTLAEIVDGPDLKAEVSRSKKGVRS